MSEPSGGQPAATPQTIMLNVGQHRAALWRNLYSNGFTFAFSPTDFSIGFLSNIRMGGLVVPSEEVLVQMTWSTMKLLSEHLASMVRTYESELGPIKVVSAIRPTQPNIDSLIKILKENPLDE
jgi:hypothetical protein